MTTPIKRAEQAVLLEVPPMRALTVRQPFADAIVHGHPRDGLKTIENRSTTVPAPAKHLGTTILIHAGKEPHELGEDVDWEQRPDVRMGIIGTARLVGVHIDDGGCCAPWGMRGYFHWQLADARALATPVPATGQLGLWTPKDDVLAAVHAQLTAGVAS
ncbi:hypothetical protein [Streptomyces sp. ME19-01-6]|uniref:hypothetical protein n=1 Tax=Streptomyces sp. ME19-01-6 TaxID=3028686 RepID=UPI0029AD86AA|nr:hypothetical protein [Streptomyces sp. ME19-01-6]MDX3232982.1 hypothetical protein [Streptomyces sp. ME19-01-6]